MTSASMGPRDGFAAIALRHLARYPVMQVEDAYKLAHQACLGSEHAVRDRAQAERWLEREFAQLGDGPQEPTVDPISPDGRIVRVHLRPFLAGGGDATDLLDAFVHTANGFRGSPERLRSCWATVEALAADGSLPFSRADAEAFGRRADAAGFPAVHHSAAYGAAYRPAYRLVARAFLPQAPWAATP
ncbi:MAG: hypothetical protein K0A98_04465 [Trueperaceae bacterium]|nr:hypothetical protein [Trueperaceae bacterium]